MLQRFAASTSRPLSRSLQQLQHAKISSGSLNATASTAVKLVHRRIPLSTPARSMSFFDSLKKAIDEQVDQNEDFKKKMEQVKQDEKMQKAADVSKKAGKTFTEGGKSAAESASRVGQKVSDAAAAIGDSAVGKGTGKILSTLGSATGHIVDKVATTGEKVIDEAKKTKVGQYVDEGIKDDGTDGLFAPKAAPESKQEEVIPDTETTAIAIAEETPWQKRMNKLKNVPVLGSALSFGESVTKKTESMGDKLFGSNETAIALSEIKLYDPYFNSVKFRLDLQRNRLKPLLQAYMEGDVEYLSDKCSEKLMQVSQAIQETKKQTGGKVTLNIIEMYDVDMMAARLEDDMAYLVYTFSVQQILYAEDSKGNVTEGAKDEIKLTTYAAVFQKSVEERDEPWKLAELVMQGSLTQIA